MSMEVTIVDNQVEVVLSGNISEEEADRIKEMLHQHIANEKTIYHMDFSHVGNISRDGIGVLNVMRKLAENKFGSFFINGLTGEVKNKFELLRMENVFEVQ